MTPEQIATTPTPEEVFEQIHWWGELELARRMISRLDAGLMTEHEIIQYLREKYCAPCDHPGHTPQGGPCGCDPDPHDITPNPKETTP